MYRIHTSQLNALYSRIAENAELILPCESCGRVNFEPYTESSKVRLDAAKTVKSPKDAFFPQYETLYTCKTQDGDIEILPAELSEKPFVLFGVRACDAAAFGILDAVFLADPRDSFYAARRELGTVVTLACGAPEDTCFCGVFGINPAEPGGDASAWILDEYLYIKGNTEKGAVLISVLEDLLEAVEPLSVEAEKARIREILQELPYAGLKLDGWGAGATEERFSSSLWESLHKACLACGTCTFVCPTCQCYDIKDYTAGERVERCRCWDSCMYSDFTMMAHGNNRTTQLQRFRQRFMHKLVYFPENNSGLFSCVGCGRCVESCPASLNIAKVIKAFEKEAADK